MNEMLLFLEMAVDFGLVLLLWRFLGKQGVYAWICIATVLANIQVTKTVELFGMTATLGNAMYASIFLATDILSEMHGKKAAGQAVLLGLVAMLSTVLVMTMTLWFVPSADDFAHESLKTLFGFMPRVVAGSLAAYAVSQLFDVTCYHWIRERLPQRRHLWVRNNVSTILSQALDTLIFTTIAFVGVFPAEVFWSIVVTTFLLKLLAALCDTPFLYLARRLRQGEAVATAETCGA